MSSRNDQDIAVTDGSESKKVMQEATNIISSMPPEPVFAPDGNGNNDDCDKDNDDDTIESFWNIPGVNAFFKLCSIHHNMSSRNDQDIAVTDGSESKKVMQEATNIISSIPPEPDIAPDGNGNGNNDDCDEDNDDDTIESFWNIPGVNASTHRNNNNNNNTIARVWCPCFFGAFFNDDDTIESFCYKVLFLKFFLCVFILIPLVSILQIACGEEGCDSPNSSYSGFSF